MAFIADNGNDKKNLKEVSTSHELLDNGIKVLNERVKLIENISNNLM